MELAGAYLKSKKQKGRGLFKPNGLNLRDVGNVGQYLDPIKDSIWTLTDGEMSAELDVLECEISQQHMAPIYYMGRATVYAGSGPATISLRYVDYAPNVVSLTRRIGARVTLERTFRQSMGDVQMSYSGVIVDKIFTGEQYESILIIEATQM